MTKQFRTLVLIKQRLSWRMTGIYMYQGILSFCTVPRERCARFITNFALKSLSSVAEWDAAFCSRWKANTSWTKMKLRVRPRQSSSVVEFHQNPTKKVTTDKPCLHNIRHLRMEVFDTRRTFNWLRIHLFSSGDIWVWSPCPEESPRPS